MTVADSQPALRVRGLAKTFSGVRALKGIDLDCPSGQITALLGPNGCGKSTVIKILAGYHDPDEGGTITINGRNLPIPVKPEDVFSRGVRFVHQDLGLVDDMTVADNLAMARRFDGAGPLRPISRRASIGRAGRQLQQVGADIDPLVEVGQLARTEQILVALARAFDSEDGVPASEKFLILDEPTALLPADAVGRVLEAVRHIRDQSGTLLYVTHRLDEVEAIGDHVIVLRDGNVVETAPLAGRTAHQLGEAVAGGIAKVAEARTDDRSGREDVVLSVKNLSGRRIQDLSIDVGRGEIVGVAGLAGCGRSELARILAGVQQRSSGSVRLNGADVSFKHPRDALQAGVAFVPSNRKLHGGLGEFSAQQNLSLTSIRPFFKKGRLRPDLEKAEAVSLMTDFDVRPPDPARRFDHFSGGNQQKIVLAKFARLSPVVFVVDEPTQGVDVMGKAEIATVLRRLADNGCSIILASSDLNEIAELCDRVAVLDRGRLVGLFPGTEITENDIATMA